MTDPGQPTGTSPGTQPPATPSWPPTPEEFAEASAGAPAPPEPAAAPYVSDVAPTMRLIPVPPPSTPPPPIPAMTTPPAPVGERYIGKYLVKSELGRAGAGARDLPRH